MWRTKATVDDTVGLLNELFARDPAAINALVNTRVPCNKKIAKHRDVQVGYDNETGEYTLGFVGLVNGLFGARRDGTGQVVAMYEGDVLVGFGRWRDADGSD